MRRPHKNLKNTSHEEYSLICAFSLQVKSRTSARGKDARGSLRAPTSLRDTIASTRDKSPSSAISASARFPAAITCRFTWRGIDEGRKLALRWHRLVSIARSRWIILYIRDLKISSRLPLHSWRHLVAARRDGVTLGGTIEKSFHFV